MVSQIFCNFESTNFSRNWVCLFFLCTVNVNDNIHFRWKVRTFVVTEFVNLMNTTLIWQALRKFQSLSKFLRTSNMIKYKGFFATLAKLWSEMNETTLGVGHFKTVSGHFFASYINIFHKTEVLTVILVCPIYINHNWIKSYDINHNFVFVPIFSIL